MHGQGIAAGERWDIEGKDENGFVVLASPDGRALTLPHDTPALAHSDYAFNATVHAFQGRTVDQAIAVLDSSHAELTTQKTFYVEVSRARDKIVLITDNSEQLAETLSWNTGDRLSGLAGKRPPEHVTGDESFLTDNGGAIS